MAVPGAELAGLEGSADLLVAPGGEAGAQQPGRLAVGLPGQARQPSDRVAIGAVGIGHPSRHQHQGRLGLSPDGGEQRRRPSTRLHRQPLHVEPADD